MKGKRNERIKEGKDKGKNMKEDKIKEWKDEGIKG